MLVQLGANAPRQTNLEGVRRAAPVPRMRCSINLAHSELLGLGFERTFDQVVEIVGRLDVSGKAKEDIPEHTGRGLLAPDTAVIELRNCGHTVIHRACPAAAGVLRYI